MVLSATQIEGLKPRDKEYSITDRDGLAIRIRPSGATLGYCDTFMPRKHKG